MSFSNFDLSLYDFLTFSNKKNNINDICKNDILLEDIAHALSMICRFNGHINTFYSVAQHSLMVSEYLEQNNYNFKIQLCGLVHDASEAYINDVVTPVKYLLDDYKILEVRIQNIIYDAFNLSKVAKESFDIIKKADSYVTSIEIENFFFTSKNSCRDMLSDMKTFSEIELDFRNRALSLMK